MHPVPSYLLARASVALAVFAALLGSTAPSPLYPTYLQTFSLSHAMVTEIFATYALGTLVALLVSSRIGSSVTDPRRMMLPGLVITAAGALTFAFANDVTMLLAGRFLNGIGTGGITAMASASLYELSPPHKRGQAAILATLAFTGGAAGGPLMSSAAMALNFAPTVSPFLFIVVVSCVAGLGLAVSSWPDWRMQGVAKSGEDDPEERSRAVIPLFVLSCLAVGIAWMLGSFIMAVGADLGKKLYGLQGAGLAGMIAAIFQLFAGLGQALCGRAGPRRSIGAGLVGIIVVQLVLLALAGSRHGYLVLGLMAACGFAYGACFVGALGLASSSASRARRATYISGFYIVGYLLNALPTLAMGLLIDRIGLGNAFDVFGLVVVLIAAAGLVLTWAVRRY
ncbi:MFS transporter [Martelella alba]|nr:MFS transporter [Martelella alba]